jgi:hypothetical protein
MQYSEPNKTKAYRFKVKSRRRVAARQRLVVKVKSQTAGDIAMGRGATGWYQARKRATQRLRSVSAGMIILHEVGYRGDGSRHWMQDLRCGHVFLASVREVVLGGADQACPFCHLPKDLNRLGSVEAIQELSLQLSHGNVLFAPENNLRGADDYYDFLCDHVGIRCLQTFNEFVQNSAHGCPQCRLRSSAQHGD